MKARDMKKYSLPREAWMWIKRLKLKPHPEGGYYRETYRCSETIPKSSLHKRYSGRRSISTAIYFLLCGKQFSAFHRLKSDETWHFYAGSPVSLFIIRKNGKLVHVRLGINSAAGEVPQYAVMTGNWFAATLAVKHFKFQISNLKSYALLGCTVAPGFDFSDFEAGSRAALCRQYPHHHALIEKLTRNNI
jgi:predicted cupin superfamily sugar epimerase